MPVMKWLKEAKLYTTPIAEGPAEDRHDGTTPDLVHQVDDQPSIRRSCSTMSVAMALDGRVALFRCRQVLLALWTMFISRNTCTFAPRGDSKVKQSCRDAFKITDGLLVVSQAFRDVLVQHELGATRLHESAGSPR